MQDITELERRIASALERIGTGLDGLGPAQDPAAAADPAEVTRLRAELEAEREVTAQLEERVRAGKDKADARASALEEDLGKMQSRVAALEEERARLKAVNDQLRETNHALREANRAGLADPELVNRALAIELDALRETRASDRSELEELLAELKPILEEAADA